MPGDANREGGPADALPWQRRLSAYLAGLIEAQAERLHAGAVSRLDRAARARPLTLAETATLSALAAYSTPRVELRGDGTPPRAGRVLNAAGRGRRAIAAESGAPARPTAGRIAEQLPKGPVSETW